LYRASQGKKINKKVGGHLVGRLYWLREAAIPVGGMQGCALILNWRSLYTYTPEYINNNTNK